MHVYMYKHMCISKILYFMYPKEVGGGIKIRENDTALAETCLNQIMVLAVNVMPFTETCPEINSRFSF